MAGRQIPIELVERILLRCRPKDVITFKLVAKNWNSLISEPRFQKEFHSNNPGLLYLNGDNRTIDRLDWDGWNGIGIRSGKANRIATLGFYFHYVGGYRGVAALLNQSNGSYFLINPQSKQGKNDEEYISVSISKQRFKNPSQPCHGIIIYDMEGETEFKIVETEFKIVFFEVVNTSGRIKYCIIDFKGETKQNKSQLSIGMQKPVQRDGAVIEGITYWADESRIYNFHSKNECFNDVMNLPGLADGFKPIGLVALQEMLTLVVDRHGDGINLWRLHDIHDPDSWKNDFNFNFRFQGQEDIRFYPVALKDKVMIGMINDDAFVAECEGDKTEIMNLPNHKGGGGSILVPEILNPLKIQWKEKKKDQKGKKNGKRNSS